jgi:hypothetical protein
LKGLSNDYSKPIRQYSLETGLDGSLGGSPELAFTPI